MQQLLADKREREKRVVAQMIQLYCSKQHHNGATLCKECSCLLSYANERIDHCPFIKEKTFCSNCQVHCYQPQMREQIRQVMRYAGPRMLLHHPVLAVRHLLESRREKNKQEGKRGSSSEPSTYQWGVWVVCWEQLEPFYHCCQAFRF